MLFHGEVVEQGQAFRENADAALEFRPSLGRTPSVYCCCASRRRQQSAEHLKSRGFSRAVRSEQRPDGALRHRKGHVVDRDEITEAASQMLRRDQEGASLTVRKRLRILSHANQNAGIAPITT